MRKVKEQIVKQLFIALHEANLAGIGDNDLAPRHSSQGNLFLHALRHLAIARPDMYVVENVPGMRAFPVVMEAMQKMPDYFVHVFCPVKSDLWLPQKRDRLIIIGTKSPFTPAAPAATRAVTLQRYWKMNQT